MTIYGIRHHGPGCARSLRSALDTQKPDLLLVESPQETEPLLAEAAREGMKPPVAILVYASDQPEQAAFYPFARFSPEWQAILWAQENGTPVRAFDLPAAHTFGLRDDTETEHPSIATEPRDPFGWFARADGYSDGERWWNDKVEERGSTGDFFAAILEAVTALRRELETEESELTLRREAWMRRCLRQAVKDGFGNIAVVCGAWHAPALVDLPSAAADNALLKNLPKTKVAATWTPWTYARLSTRSGYGAGVHAPGWYDHLWKGGTHPMVRWITRAARILRKQDLEGSSASIIEATRLADSLAGLRGRPRPGLDESLEAIRTVFCGGDPAPLAFLRDTLLVGEVLGTLPDGLSTLPLQQDIEAQQKRLRLKPAAGAKELVLDLREDGGRKRSAFLHRLLALGVHWGKKTHACGKGTFKEAWTLHWKPELVLAIIDASAHGNTLESAASNALRKAGAETSLPALTERLDLALLAQLPDAVTTLLRQLDESAAASADIADLLRTVTALVRVARYGDVRATDTGTVSRILGHLALRAHIELPAAVSGINDEAASTLSPHLRAYAAALSTYEEEEFLADFHQALERIIERPTAHAEMRGLSVRLLREAGRLDADAVATRLSHALSRGTVPAESAAWLEGFLAGQGSLLVHDQPLIALIDQWLGTLGDDTFQATLPLLRRTFGSFTPPERARIGTVIQAGPSSTPSASASESSFEINADLALPAVRLVARLLDLPTP